MKKRREKEGKKEKEGGATHLEGFSLCGSFCAAFSALDARGWCVECISLMACSTAFGSPFAPASASLRPSSLA